MAESPGPASFSPEAGGGARPGGAVYRLLGAYALVSGVALLFPSRPSVWPILLLVHLLAAAPLLAPERTARALAPLGRRFPRAAVLADWLPILIIPVLYAELALLNRAVHAGRYFDEWVMGWEQSIFGGQPSRTLAAAMPDLLVSEPLHAAYLSYYFIIYLPPLLLFLSGRKDDFRRMIFGALLAFFLHYLFFIYFPVQGPRYLFPVPGGELAQGPAYQLTHRLLEAGSSRGAAFPSSHVGVALAQTLMTGRYLPRLLPVFLIATAGLAVGAVYGGFHYATDAAAGVVLGIMAVALAPKAWRALT